MGPYTAKVMPAVFCFHTIRFSTRLISADTRHTSPVTPWVDFIETKDEGFIIVSSQKTYDREINDLRAKKHVYRYQAGEGFTFWHDVPPEDAARVKGLNNPPTQKATNIYTDCGNQTGGTLIQMLITANRV